MQTVGIIKQICFNIFYNSSQTTVFSFYTNTWSMAELLLTEQVGLLHRIEAVIACEHITQITELWCYQYWANYKSLRCNCNINALRYYAPSRKTNENYTFSPSQSVSAAKELLLSSGVPCNRFLPSNSKYYLVEKWTEAPWKCGDKRNFKKYGWNLPEAH